MTKGEALQVLDGLMLGDGSLQYRGGEARFRMDLSGERVVELLGYLEYVKVTLEKIGVQSCSGHPRLYRGVSKGRTFVGCMLESRVSPLLTPEYYKWYMGGRKEVPGSLALVPISAAHWFMNDGYFSGKPWNLVITLATHGFSLHSVGLLEQQLVEIGILHTGRSVDRRVTRSPGVAITILQGSVNQFLSIIRPYIVGPFKYKLKEA